MAILEGFRALPGIGRHEKRIRIRQRHHEKHHLTEHAGHLHQRLAEIYLGLPRIMAKRHKDLLQSPAQLTDRRFDLRVAPLIARLLKALEDLLRRMTLLDGDFPIPLLLKDSRDELQIRPQLRPGTLRAKKRRRRRMLQNPPDRVEMQPRFPLNLTDGNPVPQYPLANRIPLFHVPKHSLMPPAILQGPIPRNSGSLPRVIHFSTATIAASLLDRRLH